MKKIVVLTGSGISAESGLTTFRDAGGLWEEYKVEDVCTHAAWERQPEKLVEFYNMVRQKINEAQPNEAHLAITKLQKEFPDLEIITQNVDDLHERAGSKNILHLHGEINKLRSTLNPNAELIDTMGKDQVWGEKHPDGSRLRPHIVFFDEPVPNFPIAQKIISDADIVLVVGTSLQVYPAAYLIENIKLGTKIYIIDPGEIRLELSDDNIKHIKQAATVGVPAVVDEIINSKS